VDLRAPVVLPKNFVPKIVIVDGCISGCEELYWITVVCDDPQGREVAVHAGERTDEDYAIKYAQAITAMFDNLKMVYRGH
jgi:hypothetical protein